MRPKTNRLLMLLVGAVISGCASQTDRSSSGGGAQTQNEAAAEVPATPPAPAPAYEPEKESVQFIDRPLEETPPPMPIAVAADEEVEDLSALEDESVAEEEEAAPEEESVVEEEEAAPEEESVAEEEESVAEEEEAPEEESVAEEEEASPEEESLVDETAENADLEQAETEDADSGEVEDLATQSDDTETASIPEEKHAAADNVVDEPTPKVTTAAPQKSAPATAKSVTVNFETEPLFNFDKSTIRADQRAKLDELISGLNGAQYDSIAVVGHADRIGKDAYNQKLSERRAAEVKAYLVKKGVPSDKIRTEGRGESEPVTGDACNKIRGKALISCLQPDRRVDVSVSATKKSN